jgi:hypothetical protein
MSVQGHFVKNSQTQNMTVTKATYVFFFSSHIAFNYELLACVKNLLNALDKRQGYTEGHVSQDIRIYLHNTIQENA